MLLVLLPVEAASFLQLLEPRNKVLVQLGYLLLILLRFKRPGPVQSEGRNARHAILGCCCVRITRGPRTPAQCLARRLMLMLVMQAGARDGMGAECSLARPSCTLSKAPGRVLPPVRSRRRSWRAGSAPSQCPFGWAAPAAAPAPGLGSAARTAEVGPAGGRWAVADCMRTMALGRGPHM